MKVDWMNGDDLNNQESSYDKFVKSIDTIIM
ncbi:hypothetical protein, partial [Thomasclavelia cocleata]